MASVSGYNHHRFARSVLKKSRKWEASLTVELHNAHWKFHNSTMIFPYDHPLRPFLLALRSQVIPAALLPFLYEIQPPIAFVDGCLVVQVNDYRRSHEPVPCRVVMRPAAEGLAQTIDMAMQQRGEPWDEQFALEAESRIINTTSSPLYLGTSPVAARNANLALTLTAPAHSSQSADGRLRDPHSDTSSSSGLDLGVGSAYERMRSLLRATDRPSARQMPTSTAGPAAFTPSWLILRAKESYEAALRHKEKELTREARAAAQAAQQAALGATAGVPATPALGANGTLHSGAGGNAPTEGAEGTQPAQPTPAKPKPKKPKKRPAAADDDAEKDAPPTAASVTSAATAAATTAAGAAASANPAPAKKKKTAAAKKAEIAAAQAAQAAADEAIAKGVAIPAGSTGATAAVQAADAKPAVPAPGGDEKPKPKPKGKKKGAKAED